MASDSKIGVALIGSGLFVQDEHLPAVLACPDLELKAIYSRSLKSAQKLANTLPQHTISLYSDDSEPYDALLQRPDIHAVIIALPIMTQPDFITAALKASKHVLAEKPLAPDIAGGESLVNFYRTHIDTAKINFSIAEQMRFLPENLTGAARARTLGRVLGLRVAMATCVAEGSKYYETSWRKTPAYQGGFLLDGGVHTIASLRCLLGSEARVQRVVAVTAQLQEHLPPRDTIDAVFTLAGGGTGSLGLSFGTTAKADERVLACEKGVVRVSRDAVAVREGKGKEETEDVKGNDGGVKLEVFAWAKSLKEGKWDARQSPEEALADLEILEACLTSGDKGGQPVELRHQL